MAQHVSTLCAADSASSPQRLRMVRPSCWLSVALLVLALAAAPALALYGKKDGVELLTEKSFDATVLESPDIFLVEFFAPVRRG